MAQIVAQFFNIIAPGVPPPSNMQELVPYLLTVFIGVFLVGAVFRLICAVVSTFFSMKEV